MALRLGIDLDGVLADFDTAFESACREIVGAPATGGDAFSMGDVASADMKRAWRVVLAKPNFWSTLAPYEPDEIKRLYRRSRSRKWEVFFLTKRPGTKGDTVQFQTQWWLESHGFYLPAVMTVKGSRGEVANALRLDLTGRVGEGRGGGRYGE